MGMPSRYHVVERVTGKLSADRLGESADRISSDLYGAKSRSMEE